MSAAYVDSGLFVKSYIEEPNSKEAESLLRGLGRMHAVPQSLSAARRGGMGSLLRPLSPFPHDQMRLWPIVPIGDAHAYGRYGPSLWARSDGP